MKIFLPDDSLRVCVQAGPGCCTSKMEDSYMAAVRSETQQKMRSYSFELKYLIAGHSKAYQGEGWRRMLQHVFVSSVYLICCVCFTSVSGEESKKTLWKCQKQLKKREGDWTNRLSITLHFLMKQIWIFIKTFSSPVKEGSTSSRLPVGATATLDSCRRSMGSYDAPQGLTEVLSTSFGIKVKTFFFPPWEKPKVLYSSLNAKMPPSSDKSVTATQTPSPFSSNYSCDFSSFFFCGFKGACKNPFILSRHLKSSIIIYHLKNSRSTLHFVFFFFAKKYL